MWYARFGEALACRDKAEAGIVRFKASLRMQFLRFKSGLPRILHNVLYEERTNALATMRGPYSKALKLGR